MPDKKTIERAKQDKREGKSPSTQAGEFVKEEIDEIRQGKHGARSTRQAIAIGLSKARRAGVDLPPPRKGKKSTRKSARYAYEAGQGKRHPRKRRKVSRAVKNVLEHEPRSAATHKSLSRQAPRAGVPARAWLPRARRPRPRDRPVARPPPARRRARALVTAADLG
jgi:hypothetical protein